MVAAWNDVEIRALRSALRMSREGFAARLGVSPIQVRNWEDSRKYVKPQAKNQIALDQLLGQCTQAEFRQFERAMGRLTEPPLAGRVRWLLVVDLPYQDHDLAEKVVSAVELIVDDGLTPTWSREEPS